MNVQLRELFVAYGVTAVAMLLGLLAMRADARAYWRWPVYSAMAMVLGVVVWNLLRQHAFPAEWSSTRANTLYFCALGLYSFTGAALGLLLGRLTRGKTPESDT
jgi:Na+/glutamate symporter